MASRGGSVIVWLLATFTILTVFMPQELQVAACSEEIATCEADVVCNECMLVGDTFNQEFEDCDAEENSYCLDKLQHSCCQNQVLETDCLANEAFVAYWWSCWMHTCDISYPNAEDCSEFLGVPVTSGDVTDTGGTPAPTVAAGTLTTPSPTTDRTVPATEPPTVFVATSSMTADSTAPATAPPTAADTAVPDPIAAETPGPVEIAVGDSTVSSSAAALPTPAPVALPTPASVASETPAPAALSTPGPAIAPTESPVPAPTPTPLVVAVDTPAPSLSTVTPPASASDPSPAPTSSARDVDITPSPTTELATVGSGPSSEDTTTVTSDIDALYSSTGDCTSCIYDDECSECLSADGFTDENAAEYSECIQEVVTTTVDITDVDQCEYMLTVYCCLSSASDNDCMAMDEYVEFIQCALADCSFDDITCSGVIGAEAAGSGADPAVPLAISCLRAVSTIALGLVAVLVAMV